jgi:hypothetical protein
LNEALRRVTGGNSGRKEEICRILFSGNKKDNRGIISTKRGIIARLSIARYIGFIN